MRCISWNTQFVESVPFWLVLLVLGAWLSLMGNGNPSSPAPKSSSAQADFEIAAQQGKVPEMAIALAAGAKVNASTHEDRQAPIHLACCRAVFRSNLNFLTF